MIGYYKLDSTKLEYLPSGARNIEDDIYEICCPLIVEDKLLLPDEILCLYENLEVPVVTFEEYKNFSFEKYQELTDYLQEFSKYLKLNTYIEMLEEGSVGHLLRVGYYSYRLCKSLNLSACKCKNVYMAALFHDVGKYLVPSNIVGKREKLSEYEFNIMKKHTLYASLILDDFLSCDIIEIIREHHERCDKSGYPFGIVPSREAQILAIADSFDAMTSLRVYQDGMSVKDAFLELSLCGKSVEDGGHGMLFDNELVTEFVAGFV